MFDLIDLFFWFFFGFISGTIFLEPFIINYIYFSNIYLFLDIVLTKKNRDKLIDLIKKES